MSTQFRASKVFRDLREKAERLINEKTQESPDTDKHDLVHLIHELEIQQVELEVQNEELRRIKKELEESRDEFADLYESAPIAYLTLNRTGMIQKANRAAYRILREPQKDKDIDIDIDIDIGEYRNIKGYSFLQWVHIDDLNNYNLFLKELVLARQAGPMDIRLRRKDGPIDVRIEATADVVNEREQQYRLAFFDITERKRAEKALVAAKERASWLARFPDENPDPIMRVSAEGTVLYSNPAAQKLAGWGLEARKQISGSLLKAFGKAMASGMEAREDLEFEGRRLYSVSVMPIPEECYANVYGRDITRRKQAEDALRKAHDELELRVRERTEELAKSRERLQQLAAQLLQAQEKERKRVAIELHDSLLSELAAMKFIFESKLLLFKKGQLRDLSEFDRVTEIMQKVMKDARGIMNNLRPSILDEIGLIATIGWFTQEFQKDYDHIQIQKRVEISEEDIPDILRAVIFRVLQESLNNFAKHGKGNRVDVALVKSGDKLKFRIQDNGRGFDAGKVQKGLGLESMRERVEISGGEFQIESVIGQGTTIQATWSCS